MAEEEGSHLLLLLVPAGRILELALLCFILRWQRKGGSCLSNYGLVFISTNPTDLLISSLVSYPFGQPLLILTHIIKTCKGTEGSASCFRDFFCSFRPISNINLHIYMRGRSFKILKVLCKTNTYPITFTYVILSPPTYLYFMFCD